MCYAVAALDLALNYCKLIGAGLCVDSRTPAKFGRRPSHPIPSHISGKSLILNQLRRRLSRLSAFCCYSKIWNSNGGKYFVWNKYHSRLFINRLSTNQLAAAWKTLTTAWTLWFSTDLYSHKLSEILVLSNTESVWGLALPIMITPSSSMRTMKMEWRRPSRHN